MSFTFLICKGDIIIPTGGLIVKIKWDKVCSVPGDCFFCVFDAKPFSLYTLKVAFSVEYWWNCHSFHLTFLLPLSCFNNFILYKIILAFIYLKSIISTTWVSVIKLSIRWLEFWFIYEHFLWLSYLAFLSLCINSSSPYLSTHHYFLIYVCIHP